MYSRTHGLLLKRKNLHAKQNMTGTLNRARMDAWGQRQASGIDHQTQILGIIREHPADGCAYMRNGSNLCLFSPAIERMLKRTSSLDSNAECNLGP